MEKTAAPVFDRTGSLYVPPKRKTVAFVNVNVVPMDKNRVLASQTVIVQDGRIAQIGSMNQVKIRRNSTRERKSLLDARLGRHARTYLVWK